MNVSKSLINSPVAGRYKCVNIKIMKWNAASLGGLCLGVGLLGFVLGKVTQGGDATLSEEDQLLNRAKEVATNPAGSARAGSEGRATAGERARTATSSRIGSMDDRLKNMEDIVRGENALDRGRAMLSWIDQLAPGDFEAAVAHFRSLGMTEGRMGEYAMLLTAWAEADPYAALTYATENTRGGMATGTILAAWASRDPEAAILWAKSNHEGEDNPHMVGIIRGLAATNTARATDLLQEMPFGARRGEALAVMIPHLMNMGSDAAKSWVAGITDERLKDGAIGRLAERFASEDPEGTAAWLLANLGDRAARSMDDVYRAWAQKDKGAALSSYASLPQGDARARALRGLVVSEARSDPQAAVRLMDQYPNDVTDRVVQHFIWNSFEQDPATALSQVGKIQDDRDRDRMYVRALDSWVRRDEPAARQWIRNADLPEGVSQRFQ